MPTDTPMTLTDPLAVDAATICKAILPDIALRTWRRWDSAGKTPAGFSLGGRKLWRVSDLKEWAALGFPDRKTFNERKDSR